MDFRAAFKNSSNGLLNKLEQEFEKLFVFLNSEVNMKNKPIKSALNKTKHNSNYNKINTNIGNRQI